MINEEVSLQELLKHDADFLEHSDSKFIDRLIENPKYSTSRATLLKLQASLAQSCSSEMALLSNSDNRPIQPPWE